MRKLACLLPLAALVFACADPRVSSRGGSNEASFSDAAGSCTTSLGPETVAQADGINLTGADLDRGTAGQVYQLQEKIWETRGNWIKNEVLRKLLEKEAHKVDTNMTPEDFVSKKVDKPVSDGELLAFYNSRKAQLPKQANGDPQPFDQMKGQIKNYLEQQARSDFFEKLLADNHFQITLPQPEPPLVEGVAEGDSPATGPADAPVKIIEFADYQCPACKQASSPVHDLLKRYSGKVRLVFRDFPLTNIHQFAFRASVAAACAGQQGKYWEFHDLLFHQAPQLSVGDRRAYAKDCGLEMRKVGACMADPKPTQEVQKNSA